MHMCLNCIVIFATKKINSKRSVLLIHLLRVLADKLDKLPFMG